MKKLLLIFLSGLLVACATMPPTNTDNICATFKENEDWYKNAKHAYTRWGVPIAVQMAIMHQESHFVADAQPPRTWLLGFIPWSRPSSAYGYAQALDETWAQYLNSVGSWTAERDDFADATDFIGWYSYVSHRKLGIPKNDAKRLYLAYHEGHKGYAKGSHLRKAWLRRVANKVEQRARLFAQQLGQCAVN
ncbi:MAG: hypothetical protein WAX77_00805 [Methylococcaceae bacterium]